MWSSRARTLLPLTLIVLGAALRLNGFLADRPLSLDEAALARNLIDRPWSELLVPMDYGQVAPPGFLIVEKTLASMFGAQEYVLRLFPLLCGILSLPLCWSVARRLLSPAPAILALALFAINNAFITYSALFKQYSSDVAASLLVLLVAIALLDTSPVSRGRSVWLGLAGAATVLFSFTVVFVLIGAALTSALVASRPSEARTRPALVITLALWAAGAASGVLLGRFSLTPTDAAYMKWFWGSGFMPIPPSSVNESLWLWNRLRGVFSFTAQYRAPIGWVALVALGAWSLSRRGRGVITWLLLLPMLLVIIAAAVRLYPFESGRLQIFLLPALLILVAEGTAYWWQLFSGRARWLGSLPAVIVLALALQSTWVGLNADQGEGARPVLEYLRSNWRPGDRVYVYYAAGQEFLYYAPRYGFTEDDYTVGTCSRGNGRTYLRELDQFRGEARVWVVMSRHAVEPGALSDYLDAIGTRLNSAFVKDSSSKNGYWFSTFLYLYDLSDSSKSASVSADRFVLPKSLDNDETYPWTCYGVFTPRGSGRSY